METKSISLVLAGTAILVTSAVAPAQSLPTKSSLLASYQARQMSEIRLGEMNSRAIREVGPLLTRNSSGHLALRTGVDTSTISAPGKDLMLASLARVNELVDSGQINLTSDLRLVEPGSEHQILYSGRNYLNWYWWGYSAGLDSGRVQYLKSISGAAVSYIAGVLRYYGYDKAAGYVSSYVKGYASYMDWVDSRGGRHGVELDATWANLWIPVCYHQ